MRSSRTGVTFPLFAARRPREILLGIEEDTDDAIKPDGYLGLALARVRNGHSLCLIFFNLLYSQGQLEPPTRVARFFSATRSLKLKVDKGNCPARHADQLHHKQQHHDDGGISPYRSLCQALDAIPLFFHDCQE
jgi:hypothetical protein